MPDPVRVKDGRFPFSGGDARPFYPVLQQRRTNKTQTSVCVRQYILIFYAADA